MRSKHIRLSLITLAVTLLTAAGAAPGQQPPQGHEHPEGQEEHPTGQEHPEGQEEHAEHPEAGKEGTGAGLTKEQLADAIEAHVEKHAAQHGGFYVVEDSKTGETLRLRLDKVHEERLSRVAPETYFACADFVAEDGTRYDLDIFMKGSHPDRLETTEVSIHKVDGEERYTWVEEGGLWKKRPVGEGEGR